jgi:hypothetical protein
MGEAEGIDFGRFGEKGGVILGREARAEGVAGLRGGMVYAVDVEGDAFGDVGGSGCDGRRCSGCECDGCGCSG